MPYLDKTAKKEYMRTYKLLHREELLAREKLRRDSLRKEVLSHYSNGDIRCSCCGEDEWCFMALDHVDGGGTQHRKSLGSKYIMSHLKQLGFPTGYQVLCHNCNMAKGFYGVCPHKSKKGEIDA